MLIGEILIEGPAQDGQARRAAGDDADAGETHTRPGVARCGRAVLVHLLRDRTPARRARRTRGDRHGEPGRQASGEGEGDHRRDRPRMGRSHDGRGVRALPGRPADVQAYRGGRFRAERRGHPVAPDPPAQPDRREAAHMRSARAGGPRSTTCPCPSPIRRSSSTR